MFNHTDALVLQPIRREWHYQDTEPRTSEEDPSVRWTFFSNFHEPVGSWYDEEGNNVNDEDRLNILHTEASNLALASRDLKQIQDKCTSNFVPVGGRCMGCNAQVPQYILDMAELVREMK